MSRRTTTGDASFPIIVLLAALAWQHKALAPKVEHFAVVVALAIGAILATVLIVRLVVGTKVRWKTYSPDLSGIDDMTGLEFEQYVAKLLKRQGYGNVRLTEKYDLGIDIIARKDGITWGVQVKRYSALVGADAVRQAVTALSIYKCDRAMVITNSYFSKAAKKLAASNSCVLVDRYRLTAGVSPSECT